MISTRCAELIARRSALTEQRVLMRNALLFGIAVVMLALRGLHTDPELHKHWPGAAAWRSYWR